MLSTLNDEESWRALIGPKSRRLKDIELILRFFAFYFYANQYRSPMKDSLNRYMASNKNLERQSSKTLSELFKQTTECICDCIGQHAFRPKRAVNAAVVDSLMVGIAQRLHRGPIADAAALAKAFGVLMINGDYASAIETGTSQEANVEARLGLAQAAFKKLK